MTDETADPGEKDETSLTSTVCEGPGCEAEAQLIGQPQDDSDEDFGEGDEDGEFEGGLGPDMGDFGDMGDMGGDWEEQVAREMAAFGGPLPHLPRGLRVRSSNAIKAPQAVATAEAGSDDAKQRGSRPAAGPRRVPARFELWALGALCAASALTTGHFMFRQLFPAAPAGQTWRRGCKQCRHDWWEDFWHWRLEGLEAAARGANESLHKHLPPPGMQWEWGHSMNNTDWFSASAELVDTMVKGYADPSLGPVLQIGCGDSPIPELLVRAGFPNSEHLDIAPEVIELMRKRYPASEWPGLQFEVRDFLAPAKLGGGPPPPLHRFSAVIDKAGIWDWLQEEAPKALPGLLRAVRDALVEPPQQGAYIIATKQTPRELADTLGHAMREGFSFTVEATSPLGSTGIAWAYVLSPL